MTDLRQTVTAFFEEIKGSEDYYVAHRLLDALENDIFGLAVNHDRREYILMYKQTIMDSWRMLNDLMIKYGGKMPCIVDILNS